MATLTSHGCTYSVNHCQCSEREQERGSKSRRYSRRKMSRAIHSTSEAPGAIGPYSQAVSTTGRTIFVSGQIGVKPGGSALEEGVEAQTNQALNNMAAILAAAGSTMANVVKTTVLLKDLNDFDRVNAVYATFFPADPPARACFEVARLPKDAQIEIEAIALAP